MSFICTSVAVATSTFLDKYARFFRVRSGAGKRYYTKALWHPAGSFASISYVNKIELRKGRYELSETKHFWFIIKFEMILCKILCLSSFRVVDVGSGSFRAIYTLPGSK